MTYSNGKSKLTSATLNLQNTIHNNKVSVHSNTLINCNTCRKRFRKIQSYVISS